MSYTSTFNDINQGGENEVVQFLRSCQLEMYEKIFLDQGFETMNAVKEIREEDFQALNVLRGHRRLIQKALAMLWELPKQNGSNNSTYSTNKFLGQKRDTGGETSSGYGSQQSYSPFSLTMESNRNQEERNVENDRTSFDEEDEANSDQSRKKVITRKYRRHPKPDINCPIKPVCAYVMFSNVARSRLKKNALTFAEISKIVADQWKHLNIHEKNKFEAAAMKCKDEYIEALEKYKKTKEYKDYQDYYKEFKEKQKEENKRIMRQRKKVKRQSFSAASSSSGNMADYSSNGSSSSNNSNNDNTDI